MWRFLLAGLITGGGLVVLFIASFGDPATTSRNLHSAFAVAQRPARQLAAESTAMIEAPAAASHSDEAVPATAPRPPTSYDGVAEPSSEAITAPPGGPARGAAAEAAGVAMQAASIQP